MRAEVEWREGGAGRLEAEPLTLEELVAPVGQETFLRDYLGRQWLRGRVARGRFEDLLSWPALNQLIATQRLSAPRFRLTKDGRTLPEESYHRTRRTLRGPLRQVDPARLLAELRAGATLVWDAIDQHHPPLRDLKRALERTLRGLTWVNLYASSGETPGLGAHWDDHDVFVLQVAGRKHWRIHPPTRPSPLAGDLAGMRPPLDYAHEIRMSPGDVLYLPRGWWHLVTPLEEASLHVTAGVLRPTNADYLRWLFERLNVVELVRDDFPLGDPGERVQIAALLRSVLEQSVVPATMDAFADSDEATAYLEPRPTLQAVAAPNAEQWDRQARAQLLCSRARLEPRGPDLILRVAGNEWVVPHGAADAVAELVAGRAVSIELLLATLTAPLLSALVTAGVVAVL